MSNSFQDNALATQLMRICLPIAAVLFVFMLMLGCQTARGAEPVKVFVPAKCTSFACLVDDARKKLRKQCRKALMKESVRRRPNTVWPYDDPQWQHEACRKYALAKYPR